MSALPYIISKNAITDLEEIWLYSFQNWSTAQADRYYHLIWDEIKFICKNPGTGKSFEQFRKGYIASKVKSHLIFYRIKDNTIEIIRILHERMDIENQLKK